MASFFIRRPIVAIVIAILTVIVGADRDCAFANRTVSEHCPAGNLVCKRNYPGADAKTLEQSVATPIEQQVTGRRQYGIHVFRKHHQWFRRPLCSSIFDLKTDPNMDLILTQSRQQLANGQLPPEVTSYGITFAKVGHRSFSCWWACTRPTAPATRRFLSNYAYINLNDPIGRSYGVGRSEVLRGRPVCDAALDKTRSTGEAGHHRNGHY